MQDAVQAELDKKPVVPEVKPADPIPPVADKPEDQKPEDKPEDKKPDNTEDPKPVELDKKFVPFSRFKDVNDKYNALKKERDDALKNAKPITFENEDEREEHERLKKLWFATKDEGDMTKFQLKEDALRQEEQQILDKTIRKLEKEFDWTDWLPVFNKDDVINRGIENQVFDPQSAYIIMNLPTIINHFVKKEITELRKQPSFAKSNEVKQPDILPKWKLSLNDGSLKNHLSWLISWMIGR